MHYFLLYVEFIKLRLLGIAEYRKAFFLGISAQIVSYGAEFFIIWILINRFKQINGWGPSEVLLLFALNLCSYAIASFFFFSPTSQLSNMIKNGTFDEVLTKPLNSFLYLICREFNTGYFSHLILSIGVMLYSLYTLEYNFTLFNVSVLIIIILGSAAIQGAALIITSVPAFWLVENKAIKNILFFQLKSFIRYPITIYNKFIQILLTYILPYAFINFFPAQYIINGSKSSSIYIFTPLIGTFLMILAYKYWNFGIKHYKSTGS